MLGIGIAICYSSDWRLEKLKDFLIPKMNSFVDPQVEDWTMPLAIGPPTCTGRPVSTCMLNTDNLLCICCPCSWSSSSHPFQQMVSPTIPIHRSSHLIYIWTIYMTLLYRTWLSGVLISTHSCWPQSPSFCFLFHQVFIGRWSNRRFKSLVLWLSWWWQPMYDD